MIKHEKISRKTKLKKKKHYDRKRENLHKTK